MITYNHTISDWGVIYKSIHVSNSNQDHCPNVSIFNFWQEEPDGHEFPLSSPSSKIKQEITCRTNAGGQSFSHRCSMYHVQIQQPVKAHPLSKNWRTHFLRLSRIIVLFPSIILGRMFYTWVSSCKRGTLLSRESPFLLSWSSRALPSLICPHINE